MFEKSSVRFMRLNAPLPSSVAKGKQRGIHEISRMPRERHVRTYFNGEGAIPKKRKLRTKEEWQELNAKFPHGLPKRRRDSDCRPQRTLKIYDIRASTTTQEVGFRFIVS